MRKPTLSAWLLLAPMHLLLAAVIAVPSLWVLWLSLNESSYGTGLTFVGLDNYAKIFADPYFWRAAWNTFIVVNVVVYVEMGLALGLALLFAGGLRYPRLMFAIVLVPYAISEVVSVLELEDPDGPGRRRDQPHARERWASAASTGASRPGRGWRWCR